MQPLQIQGYSGQGIKRKTPTGDGNVFFFRPLASILSLNKKKDPDRGRKLLSALTSPVCYMNKKKDPDRGRKLFLPNRINTGPLNKKKDPDRGRKPVRQGTEGTSRTSNKKKDPDRGRKLLTCHMLTPIKSE